MEKESSRVIIVDDMVINRMIISSLLAGNGIKADQAESGRECIELCKKNNYDLILLDHRMPKFDGVDTLVALKDIFKDKGRDVPVICHTTEEGRKNINLYKAAGFADVLIKPIDPKQLADVLITYLPERDELPDEDDTLLEEIINDSDIIDDERDELDKLPDWLKTVPHIDLVKGIDNCGSAEDYIDALYVFYSSIDEKSDDIAHFRNFDELTMYKLSVHSLKSMSALVGARDLSVLAKELEEAAKNEDIKAIRDKTPELLESYRKFKKLLSPLMDDVRRLVEETACEEEKEEDKDTSTKRYRESRTVLYIRPGKGIVTKGIEKSLSDIDYRVISVEDEPDEIIKYKDEADIILYHPVSGGESHIGITMNLLSEICRDDMKIFLLMGDSSDIEIAKKSSGFNAVSEVYSRPVNMQRFVDDIEHFTLLLEEYHRKKTIFIVDDDPDYISVVTRWLSKDYQISTFNAGEELIKGLSVSKPDLILMDYEMPGLDGYDLMKYIKSDESTKYIPVIFLTGKNDREHVFKILNYKPDGYLLKTSQKENLIDSIDRFFLESLFGKAKIL